MYILCCCVDVVDVGPPGTGKTKTVVAILNTLHLLRFTEWYDHTSRSFADYVRSQVVSDAEQHAAYAPAPTWLAKKPRLLVCAPSNAAVDEVIHRILV